MPEKDKDATKAAKEGAAGSPGSPGDGAGEAKPAAPAHTSTTPQQAPTEPGQAKPEIPKPAAPTENSLRVETPAVLPEQERKVPGWDPDEPEPQKYEPYKDPNRKVEREEVRPFKVADTKFNYGGSRFKQGETIYLTKREFEIVRKHLQR